MTSDKTRFDLSTYPLPKNAQGKTFFDKRLRLLPD